MARRFVHRRSAKTGLPPGTLVHVGEGDTKEAHISVTTYDQSHYQRLTSSSVEQAIELHASGRNLWINLDAVHDVETVRKLGEHFKIHPLILEDIVNPNQRPKRENYADFIFIVARALKVKGGATPIDDEQVSIVMGKNFVISFQEKPGDVFAPIYQRFENSAGRLRTCGVDYLTYALLDTIVDEYFVVLESMGERLEELEQELIKSPSPKTLKTLYSLKRMALFFRRCTWPLREVLSSIERGDSPLFGPSTHIYFRDVYDHIVQVIDTIETFREMLSGMLDIYLSSVSNRLNEVMRVLTVITTIFMPLSFIAGVYGMNFDHMPELRWQNGYFLVLGLMAIISLLMILFFRSKKWL
ncbi:MAG: magnesium and cobalt transport protein CorA [Proteobacteria bacterium]|nr:MAG: magnesium and cobalt transport protein CorA [Pseudomonadota bacterium]